VAEAHELARALRARHEGTPAFDFHYGLAAVETGHLDEGVLALERVLMTRPSSGPARLALARAYYLQGDDRRARAQFEAVLAGDPSPMVTDRVARYLAALDRRADRYETRVSGRLELGAGHDSNVNSATSADSIETILGDIPLSAESRARADRFLRLGAHGRLSHPLRPGLNAFARAEAGARMHAEEKLYDSRSLDAAAGLLWRQEGWRVRASASRGGYWLDGTRYRNQAGLRAGVQHVLSQDLALRASLERVRLDYVDNDNLDATVKAAVLGTSWRLPLPRRPLLGMRLLLAEQTAARDTLVATAGAERDLLGVGATLRLWPAPQWRASLGIDHRTSEYGGEDPIFGRTREETATRLDLALTWRPTARWSLGPRLRHTRNRANIELYGYRRTELELRARYAFH
jgi:hypothetical protein